MMVFAGFTGCVGALRENTTLLAAYAIFLAILLLLEVLSQKYLIIVGPK